MLRAVARRENSEIKESKTIDKKNDEIVHKSEIIKSPISNSNKETNTVSAPSTKKIGIIISEEIAPKDVTKDQEIKNIPTE